MQWEAPTPQLGNVPYMPPEKSPCSNEDPAQPKINKIIFKKEWILKATREKRMVTYKGTPFRLSADFSAETLQARRKWNDILIILRD